MYQYPKLVGSSLPSCSKFILAVDLIHLVLGLGNLDSVFPLVLDLFKESNVLWMGTISNSLFDLVQFG